jgi:hypothetical protein
MYISPGCGSLHKNLFMISERRHRADALRNHKQILKKTGGSGFAKINAPVI